MRSLARLFEDYFQSSFREMLAVKPQFHRVIPVNETIRNTMEVRPFESAAEIVDAMQSWGVLDCICRKQKALIGQACEHPIDVCMVMDPKPDAFDGNSVIRALTRDEAMGTLHRAAEAGLVHSVSNNQEGLYYVCNCCTCSCGSCAAWRSWGSPMWWRVPHSSTRWMKCSATAVKIASNPASSMRCPWTARWQG